MTEPAEIEGCIVCDAGGAPRVLLRSDFFEASFALDAWGAFVAQIRGAWQTLRIRCTCGHPFGSHHESSPHACGTLAEICRCERFTAAEPLLPPPTLRSSDDDDP